MFDVTDKAIEKLQALRDTSEPQPGQAVTLVVREGGELGLALAFPQETDHVIERDGEPVMIVPEPLLEPLSEITLDYVESGDQEGFTLDHQDGASAT
jgi:Fe-S cluster assembly iron-binding protein IscA